MPVYISRNLGHITSNSFDFRLKPTLDFLVTKAGIKCDIEEVDSNRVLLEISEYSKQYETHVTECQF